MFRGSSRGNPCKWCLKHGFTEEFNFQHRRACQFFKCKCALCATIWSAEPRQPKWRTAVNRPSTVNRHQTDRSKDYPPCIFCKNHGLHIYAIGQHLEHCKFRDCNCSSCCDNRQPPASRAEVNMTQVTQAPQQCPFCAHHNKVNALKEPHTKNCRLRNKCGCPLCTAEHNKLKGGDAHPREQGPNQGGVEVERTAKPSDAEGGRKRKRSSSPPPAPSKQSKKEPDVFANCPYCLNHGWKFPLKEHHYGVCMYKRCDCILCAKVKKECKGSASAEHLARGDTVSCNSQAVSETGYSDRDLQAVGSPATANVVVSPTDSETAGLSADTPEKKPSYKSEVEARQFSECETVSVVAVESDISHEDNPLTAISSKIAELSMTTQNLPEDRLLAVISRNDEDSRSDSRTDVRELIAGESFIIVDDLNQVRGSLQEGPALGTDESMKDVCKHAETACSGVQCETSPVIAVESDITREDDPQTEISSKLAELSMKTTQNLPEDGLLTVISPNDEDSRSDTRNDVRELIAGESFIVVDDLNQEDSSLQEGQALGTEVNSKDECKLAETSCSDVQTTEVLDGECFIVLDEISNNSEIMCSSAAASLGDESSNESTSCENSRNEIRQVSPVETEDDPADVQKLAADLHPKISEVDEPSNILCAATGLDSESPSALSTDIQPNNSKVMPLHEDQSACCTSSDVPLSKSMNLQAAYSSPAHRSRKDSFEGKKPCAIVAPKPRGVVHPVELEVSEGRSVESVLVDSVENPPGTEVNGSASTVVSSDFTSLMAELAKLEQNYQRAVPYSRISSVEDYSILPVMDKEIFGRENISVLVDPKNPETPSRRSVASEMLRTRESKDCTVENVLCDVCGKIFNSLEPFHLHSHWHQDGNGEVSRAKSRCISVFKSNAKSVSGTKARAKQYPKEAEIDRNKHPTETVNQETQDSSLIRDEKIVGCICYVCGVAFPTVHQYRLHAYLKHNGIDIESTEKRYNCRTCSFEDRNEIAVDEHESAHLGLVPLDRLFFLFSSLKDVISSCQATQP